MSNVFKNIMDEIITFTERSIPMDVLLPSSTVMCCSVGGVFRYAYPELMVVGDGYIADRICNSGIVVNGNKTYWDEEMRCEVNALLEY